MVATIKDMRKRIVRGWGSVSIPDLQGDYIPADVLEKAMIDYMDRGGFILYRHENKPIGKIVGWQIKKHEKTGKEGLEIIAKIFDDYKLDDIIWNAIKKGELKGFSIGALVPDKDVNIIEKDGYKEIKDLEINEFSIVIEPANPEALIEEVSMAKEYDEVEDIVKELGLDGDEEVWKTIVAIELSLEEIEKKIVKRGDKFCIVHCHGPDKGKDIACHDTKEEALAQHRAIMVNKMKEMVEAVKDERPPKEWWERAVRRLRNVTSTPERLAGWVWYHHKKKELTKEDDEEGCCGNVEWSKELISGEDKQKEVENMAEKEVKKQEEGIEPDEDAEKQEEGIEPDEDADKWAEIIALLNEIKNLLTAKEEVVEEEKEDEEEDEESEEDENEEEEEEELEKLKGEIVKKVLSEIKKQFDVVEPTKPSVEEHVEMNEKELIKEILSGKKMNIKEIMEVIK